MWGDVLFDQWLAYLDRLTADLERGEPILVQLITHPREEDD